MFLGADMKALTSQELLSHTLDKEKLALAQLLHNELNIMTVPFLGEVLAVDSTVVSEVSRVHDLNYLVSQMYPSLTPEIYIAESSDLEHFYKSVDKSNSNMSEYENPSRAKFESLLTHAISYGCNDIHIRCFRDEGNAYALLKVDGRVLLEATWKFVNYEQCWKMLCSIYDNSTGKQKGGEFNETSEQDTDLTYQFLQPIESSRGKKITELKLRLAKTVPDRLAGETYTVLRIINDERVIDIRNQGYDENLILDLSNAIRRSSGAVVTCGPTGSGKSTLMVSSLDFWPDNETMITLEDPVEYKIKKNNIIQKQIDDNKPPSAELRYILRQNPDGVMVGETRDLETLELVVQVAESNHFCITTTHATDCIGILDRFSSLGIHPKKLSTRGVLSMLITQRLVRELCPHCKKTVKLDGEEGEMFNRQLAALGIAYSENLKVESKSGCKHCEGKGYIKRFPVTEHLVIESEHLPFIAENDLIGLRHHLEKNGFQFYTQKLVDLAAEGRISISDAYKQGWT